MKIYSLFLFCLCAVSLVAQKNEAKRTYGEVSKEELTLTTYEADPEAEAVVLFDLGKSVFIDRERSYDIKFTRHKRIKILDKTAFDQAEIKIPFYENGYGKTERVKAIAATSYTMENGKLVTRELDPKTIYEEQINDRWKVKKFAIPNVQEGSVIEYRYVLETPFHYNLPDWTFQDRIPTVYSEYQVAMIPFYEYAFIAQGITEFDYHNMKRADEVRTFGTVAKAHGQNVGNGVEFQDFVCTYALEDVPAFKDESYISSVDDYIIKIDFQLAKVNYPNGGGEVVSSDWATLNKELLEHDKFGRYLKTSQRLAKKILAEELNLSDKKDAAKLKAIVEYVRNNFVWNNHTSKYASQSPKQLLAKRSGNSADLNLFMIALLRQAGFDTDAVILSTRDNGKLKTDYAFNHFTNYVVPFINWEVSFLVDATDTHLPFDRIPLRCINELGLIVQEGEAKWLTISHAVPSIEKYTIATTIDPENLAAHHKLSIQTTEYNSYLYRRGFKDDETAIKEAFNSSISEVTRFKTVNYDKQSSPYMLFFEGDCELESLGSNLILKPFLSLGMSENKLKQEKRDYPVDFIYPTDEIFDIRIAIPEGYTVADLPDNKSIDDELVSVELTYRLKDEVLLIKGHYMLKHSMYMPSQYAVLKAHLDTIVTSFQKEIVLEQRT